MLAEAVSIDGGTLLLILAALALFALLWCVMVALGFRWARRAGEGSAPALRAWAVVAVLEVAPLVAGMTNLLVMSGILCLGLQIWVYLHAKARAAGDQP